MHKTITCPHCSESFTSSNGAVAGQRIECELCSKPFLFQDGSAAPEIREGKLEKRKKKSRTPKAIGVAPPPSMPAMGLFEKPSHRIKTGIPVSSKNSALTSEPFAPPSGSLASQPFDPPLINQPKSNKFLAAGIVLGVMLLFLGAGAAVGMAIILGTPGENLAKKNQPDGTANQEIKIAEVGKKGKANEVKKESLPEFEILPVSGKADDKGDPPPVFPKFEFDTKPGKGAKSKKDSSKKKPRKGKTADGKYRIALSMENQKKVNDAISKGVAYLRKTQQKNGSWKNTRFPVGYTSLAGLTLLECDAKADDPAVQKAASFVRFNSHRLTHTYQLSLAILFLDKVGDKQDSNLIRKLALRLVAGQTAAGGWNYTVPMLNDQDTYQLITFLHHDRKNRIQIIIAQNDQKKTIIPVSSNGNGKTVPVTKNKKKKPDVTVPVAKNGTKSPKKKKGQKPGQKGLIVLPFDKKKEQEKKKIEAEKKRIAEAKKKAEQEKKRQAEEARRKRLAARPKPFPMNQLNTKIRSLPIVKNNGFQKTLKKRGKARKGFGLKSGRDDNSNTQFAMLALWAARRYGVPVDRTMSLVEERFEVSQNGNGGWGYSFRRGGTTPQMTCVGLIGLAVGHGAYKETFGNAWKGSSMAATKAKKDVRIQNGLKHLTRWVGNAPMDWKKPSRQINLYYLWSLERAAMLYNLKTLGGRDWYGWAAHMLVTNQRPDGNWAGGGYHGSSPTLDTCMALLVLKRANLAEDLSQSLKLYIPIVDPGAGSK